MSPSQAKAISDAFGGEFMAPEAAMGRLATIAQGEDVRTGTSKRGDAQCVSVTAKGVRTETACVNPGGLLAFFDGTTDAGRYTQLTLQYTTPSVSDEAFLPPTANPKASATPTKARPRHRRRARARVGRKVMQHAARRPGRCGRRWHGDGMELHCDTCARQRIFEQPACTDHPRETCPDRACTGCGAAIVVAPVILLMIAVRGSS